MTFSSHNSQLVAGLASGTTILQSCIFPLYPHRTLSWGTWAHHTWYLFTPNSAFLITHMWYHSSNSSTVIFLFLLQVFSKTITYSKVSIIQRNLSTECRNDLWRLLPSPVIAHFSPILESTHFPSHDTNCKKRQAMTSWSFPRFICFSYKPEANMENSISVHFSCYIFSFALINCLLENSSASVAWLYFSQQRPSEPALYPSYPSCFHRLWYIFFSTSCFCGI